MKPRKITAVILAVILLCALLPTGAVGNESGTQSSSKYEYFLKTPPENAYVLFGAKTESRYCSFADCKEMGITDSTNTFYSEDITLDGLDGRYFNNKNLAKITVDKDFYTPEDNEFVFSIVFYDFGPSQGTFYFEYVNTAGETKRITLIKPGKVQGWFVKTVWAQDADLSKTLENGGNIQLVTGGYNAFKKVEITNLSKLKREGKSVEISSLSSEYGGYFKQLGLIKNDDTRYEEANMYKKCTASDTAQIIKALLGGENGSALAGFDSSNRKITQNELCSLFLKTLGITPDEDALSHAQRLGIITGADLILDKNAEASYYNLLSIAYNAFYYVPAGGASLAEKLIKSGIYTMDSVKSFTDPKFLEIYYNVPIYCPYKKITDYETGRTFYYMNFFGEMALRPYVTMQSWTNDSKKFIGGTRTGYMFLYDTETQMLTFVDDNMNYYGAQMINATIGTDDHIYYVKKENGHNGIWRCDTKTLKKEKLTDIADNVTVGGVSITNDCKYIGFDYTDPYNTDFPSDLDKGARYSIETNEWKIFAHEFEISQYMNHVQVNPENPDLMFFCHEMAGVAGMDASDLCDRIYTYDYSTDTANNVFKQGSFNGKALQTATHEVWSYDGEYIFFILLDGKNGRAPAAMRIDKDGRHRQYYHDPSNALYGHCNATKDGKYIVADGNYVTVINTDTHQAFKITRWIGHGYAEHPYHPHPHVSRNGYMANWGMRDTDLGTLGIMWYDFSEIVKNEIAEGGRYPAGENVDRVSYKGLKCETSEVTKNGRECIFVKKGNNLCLDVSKEVSDSVNDSVTITFDYLDTGKQPVVLTYTAGVKTDNDYWKIDNATKKVKRNGTNKWKTATLTIESGNFENPAEHYTDLKLSGLSSNLYITNIKVRKGK